MKSCLTFIVGLISGILTTLILLPKLPEILGIKKEELNTSEELDEYDPAECEGCIGPAWVNYKPRCGKYPGAPPCNNPIFKF